MKKLIACLFVVFMGLPAVGAVVFSDDFSDGNRDGWYRVTASTSWTVDVIDDSAGVGSGNALGCTNTSSSTSRAVVANFADVTLGASESIRLSFVARAYSSNNSSGDFRFGLFNSQGSVMTADEDSSGTTDDNDRGYFARGSTGTTLYATQIVEESAVTTIMGGSGLITQGTAATSTTMLPWTTPATIRSFVFEIRLNGTGDTLLMDLWVDNVLAVSGNDMGGTYFTTTFNEVGFASNSNPDFVIDNVNVEYTVPEPATLSILALGALAALRRKHRA